MTTATLAIAFALQTFPTGTTIADYEVTLTGTTTGAQPAQTLPASAGVPGTPAAAVFPDLQPDSYTASCQAVDASGDDIGEPATTSFTVTAPTTVSLAIPTSISVTQA